RIGPASERDSEFDDLFDAWHDEFLVAQQALAARIVTDDEDVRLAAMQQCKRYAGIGRMKDGALSFDDIPMVRSSIRAQHFCSAGGEVGHDCVHRNPAA